MMKTTSISTKQRKEDASQVSIIAAKFWIGIVDSHRLIDISRNLKRIGERSCNGYHSDLAQRRDDMKGERLFSEAVRICGPAITVFHQTDPRGCQLYLGDTATIEAEYDRRLRRDKDAIRHYPSVEHFVDCNYSSLFLPVF